MMGVNFAHDARHQPARGDGQAFSRWYAGRMARAIEPGLIRAFRYFTFISLCYYAILVVFELTQSRQQWAAVQVQWYLNLLGNLALFLYLSLPQLSQRLGDRYLPIAFALSAGTPLLSNLMLLVPLGGNLPWDVDPSWLTFPNLLVTAVLLAWQYSYSAVLLLIISAALLEVAIAYSLVGTVDFHTLPLIGLPLLRAFAAGVIGQIVSRMVTVQRAQRRELVLANVRLSQHAATLEQLTLSRERNRLARELHDTLAHTLSGQAVNLEAIKLSLQPEQGEVATMLDQALTTTRDGLTDVRRAIRDLRSQPLEDLGLALAIQQMAVEASARGSFALDHDILDPLPALEPAVEHAFYRIAQESLENAIKHAKASTVRLRLGVENKDLCLTITDDGTGSDLAAVDFAGRHGLIGMQERAAMVGGRLVVDSRPEHGTTVRFAWAVPHD